MAKSPETEHPQKAFGWAARDNSGVLSPFSFSRRENGDEDVTIKIHFCGICHSDLHLAKNDWGSSIYPMVPGHEMVGIVTKSGKNVDKFKPGDRVGVGMMVGSCRSCDQCNEDLENYCAKMMYTYNSIDAVDGTTTYGGFSDMIIVNHHFVVRIPDAMPFDAGAAPLLCAGVTVYSPMKYYGMLTEPGKHLGVAGLGGLGHVAVKIGKALGLKVTVISHSPAKESDVVGRLGADGFIVSTDPVKMKAAYGSLDYIIDTVSPVHALTPLLALLKTDGKLITLCLPVKPLELSSFSLALGRKMVGGSYIGGMKETQEMLDFCAKHDITSDVEVVSIDQVNVAMARLAKSDVRYRFVIDVASSFSK